MPPRDNQHKRLAKTLVQVLFWALLGGTLAYANADWHKQSPIPGPGNRVVAAAVTPDGTHAATVTDDGHISLWNLDTQTLVRTKHLPEGTPHHLAIRNQADAIAIAYEDANAVIWWCDGSDKVVPLNVQARLVAFANKKRKVATLGFTDEITVWDITTGDFTVKTRSSGSSSYFGILTFLTSDEAVIASRGPRNFFSNLGLELTKGSEIIGFGSISSSWNDELALLSEEGKIVLDRIETTGNAYSLRHGPHNQQVWVSSSKNDIPPVCMTYELPRSYGGNLISSHGPFVSHRYIPIYKNNRFTHVVSGNAGGDLIIYQRSRPGDWIYFPVSWFLIVVGGLFLAQIVVAMIAISRKKKTQPNVEDAVLPLPGAARAACYVIAIVGGLTTAGMIAELFFDGLNLNFMFLLLPAGIMVLKHKSNGWRKCGVFFIWAVMLVGGIILGTSLLAKQPFTMDLGQTQHVAPVWVGIAIGLLVTLAGAFSWHALTDPRVKRICAAASYAGKYSDLEIRRQSLMACPDCGYDTRQTVRDGLEQCPECGRAIPYTDDDRAWISRRVDDWRQPNDRDHTQP